MSVCVCVQGSPSGPCLMNRALRSEQKGWKRNGLRTADTSEHLGVLVVDEVGQVASVVEDHVELLSVGPDEGLVNAPEVLLLGLTLPGIDGNTRGSDSGGSWVLSGEDVAGGPLDGRTEGSQSLDEHGGLDGHVQATSNASTLQGLSMTILLAKRHQTGHLILGKGDQIASKLREANIGDLVGRLVLRGLHSLSKSDSNSRH